MERLQAVASMSSSTVSACSLAAAFSTRLALSPLRVDAPAAAAIQLPARMRVGDCAAAASRAVPSRPFSPVTASVAAPAAAAAAAEVVLDDAEIERKYPPFAAFRIHGTGRRKTAVARVGLIEGEGNIFVNDKTLTDYFQNQALLIQAVKLPLTSLGYDTKYDVVVKAHGGGLSAQAQAMVMGIARALVAANAANRPPLKAQGMLTRDARAVERKKYGLKKARKAPQYSKR